MRPKSLLAIIALGVPSDPAQSRSLHVTGTAGYLSEWEIRATVSEDAPSEGLSGPITMTHAGLCTVKGPVEKSGEIKVKISGWGPLSRIDAVMSFGNEQCVYRGGFANGTRGAMDCSDAKGIPLSL